MEALAALVMPFVVLFMLIWLTVRLLFSGPVATIFGIAAGVLLRDLVLACLRASVGILSIPFRILAWLIEGSPSRRPRQNRGYRPRRRRRRY